LIVTKEQFFGEVKFMALLEDMVCFAIIIIIISFISFVAFIINLL